MNGKYFANAGQTDGLTDGQTDDKHHNIDARSLWAYKNVHVLLL